MNTYRLFIAINLPPQLLNALRLSQRHLQRKLASYPLRWARPEGIHLTLKFLGDTDVARIDEIIDGLMQVGRRHAPFELAVGGLGMFPNANRPSVLWMGVRDEHGRLRRLAEDVDKAMARMGWKRERRPFQGHLTLARVQKRATPRERRQLGALIASLRGYETLGILPVETFQLMRSQLHPQGAIYTTLHTIRLTAEPHRSL